MLAQQIYDEFQPQGPVEEALAQQIVADIWRLRRLDAAEHAQLEQAIESQAMHRQYARAIQKIRDDRIAKPLVQMDTERLFREVPKAESRAEDLAGALADSVSNMPRVQVSTVVERLRRSINKGILQNQLALERMQERRRTLIEVVKEDPRDQATHKSPPQEAIGSRVEGANAPNGSESSDAANAEANLLSECGTTI
jgi:hypothetical protein